MGDVGDYWNDAKNYRRRMKARAARVLSEPLPIGTAVDVTRDDGTVLRTITRSEPWQLGHGQWVVMVEGISGGYDLGRVRAI